MLRAMSADWLSLVESSGGLLLAAFGAYALSLLITWCWSWAAPRLGFLDRPGARRLHRSPVPRGGGIGIVLVSVLALLHFQPLGKDSGSVALALLALAGVGLYDDFKGAAIGLRLLIQLGAALALAAAVLLDGERPMLLPLLIAILLTAAWINVFNFMDGANGMAGQQAVFMAAVTMGFAALARETSWVLYAMALAGAVLGFLPFNVPRARVFLGDVGSTALAFALAAPLVALVASGHMSLPEVVLFASAFLVDTSATWIGRVSRGRGWYTAHREHLYQWLVRSGYSHVQVAALYASWNLLVVVPLLAAGRSMPAWQPLFALIGLVLGLGLWRFGRAHALARLRAQAR